MEMGIWNVLLGKLESGDSITAYHWFDHQPLKLTSVDITCVLIYLAEKNGLDEQYLYLSDSLKGTGFPRDYADAHGRRLFMDYDLDPVETWN